MHHFYSKCLIKKYCSPPPPDDMTGDRRSRRDLSPITRRVTDSESYSVLHPREVLTTGRRSLSATSQFRSKSPPKRSYSPIRNESIEFVTTHPPPRVHRSATATPQGSPKKRQLPIIPPARERLSQVIFSKPKLSNNQCQSTYLKNNKFVFFKKLLGN